MKKLNKHKSKNNFVLKISFQFKFILPFLHAYIFNFNKYFTYVVFRVQKQ